MAIETENGDCPLCSVRHERNFYGCCKLIGNGHNSKTCTKRRICRDCDGKHPTILHGLQLKKNDKAKSEKEIRKKEADKADSTELIRSSTKMKQVISMWVVPVKARPKLLSRG